MTDVQEINIDRCGSLIDWYYDALCPSFWNSLIVKYHLVQIQTPPSIQEGVQDVELDSLIVMMMIIKMIDDGPVSPPRQQQEAPQPPTPPSPPSQERRRRSEKRIRTNHVGFF